MKFNQIASAFVLVTGMASFGAAAASQGAGHIDFVGSIIDAPCSIDPSSGSQEVDLGQVAQKQLADGGKSYPQKFEIKLMGCELNEGASAVSLTFGGSPADDSNQLLGITGTASGAGVAMTDASSKIITLGEATDARELIEGTNIITMSAYLQGLTTDDVEGGGDGTRAAVPIVPGDFYASTDFTLSYE